MPDYQGLMAELALPQYAGMTDDQIAAALETPVTRIIDAPVSRVQGYLLSRGLMGGIRRFVASPPANVPAALVEGLSDLLDMVSSPHVDVVAMTDPAVAAIVKQVLDGAVTVGLMSAQNEADLIALSAVTTTRAAELGLEADVHVAANEIAAVRAWH